jgi:hypothetical protein
MPLCGFEKGESFLFRFFDALTVNAFLDLTSLLLA